MEKSTFLTPEEVAELTGVKTGRARRTREELQADWLRTSGIPYFINARGRPIIVRAVLEGRKEEQPARPAWRPRVISA